MGTVHLWENQKLAQSHSIVNQVLQGEKWVKSSLGSHIVRYVDYYCDCHFILLYYARNSNVPLTCREYNVVNYLV